jgi:hypothetical protein
MVLRLNEKIIKILHEILEKKRENSILFEVTKYGILRKKYKNRNIKKFRTNENNDIKYLYMNRNNCDVVYYNDINDIEITDDTLRYALKVVGVILSVEFSNSDIFYVMHINKNFGDIYNNFFKWDDFSSLTYWFIEIIDYFNLYYIYFYDKIKKKKIYLNIFDQGIYPKPETSYSHPFESVRLNLIENKYDSDIKPDFDVYPIYSWSSGKNFFDICLPMPDIISFLMRRDENYDIDILSKNTKIYDKILFRGSHSSYHINVEKDIRLQAHIKSLKFPNSLDIIISPNGNLLYDNCRISNFQELKNFNNNNYLLPIQQSQYRYILDLDGIASPWRIIKELYYKSVIIIPESQFTDVIRESIIPYKHYFPVNNDLSNLVNTQRYLKNTEEGKKIAENIVNNTFEFSQYLLDFDIHMDLMFERIEKRNYKCTYLDIIKNYDRNKNIIVPSKNIENDELINLGKKVNLYYKNILDGHIKEVPVEY